MSAHELPADLAQWPEDPYELLGVSHETTARDLKRAYARLIRTYKPELYPEHFRRIREAYESVVRFLEWSLPYRMARSEEEPTDDASSETADSTEVGDFAEQSDGTRRVPATLRVPSLEEELRELWQQAAAGQPEAAYRGLVSRSATNQGNPEICLRCYWLLTLWPELDKERTACDWLVAGLRATQLTGPMFELYRRELASAWDEAIQSRCEQLLDAPASPWALLNLAECRWRMAVRGPDLIWVLETDLERMRPRMFHESEECWVQALILAVSLGIWEEAWPHSRVAAFCDRQFQELEHLHMKLAGYFDRLDLLLAIVGQWRSLSDAEVGFNLLELVRLSWTASPGDIRLPLLKSLQEIAEQPTDALFHFDLLKQKAPVLVFRFSTLLKDLQEELELSPDPRGEDTVAWLIDDFLQTAPWYKYRALRSQLLDFCRREAISPEQVAETIAGNPKFKATADQHLSHLIQDDWPLRCVCQASRLFWAA